MTDTFKSRKGVSVTLFNGTWPPSILHDKGTNKILNIQIILLKNIIIINKIYSIFAHSLSSQGGSGRGVLFKVSGNCVFFMCWLMIDDSFASVQC